MAPALRKAQISEKTAVASSEILFLGQRSALSSSASAAQGDALYDLATLTLGHEKHLADVVAGYGDVDLDVIRGRGRCEACGPPAG
jgi:hypothetical protein